MSIQEHLNKIRNAIKGSEVRESIAKGIETVYDDASEYGNANMEVKLARGTNPNLNTRLNNMDETDRQTTTQLAHKADESEMLTRLGTKREQSKLIGANDIDGELLGLLEGSGGGSVTVESTPKDRSVTQDKTTFARERLLSKNLFDKSAITTNRIIDFETGEIGYHESQVTSDYIEVLPSTEYWVWVPSDQGRTIAHYDEGKNFIETTGGRKLTTPSNARFVRITFLSNELEQAMFSKGGTKPHFYEPFKSRTEISDFYYSLSGIKEGITSEDRLDKSIVVTGDNLDFLKRESPNLFNKELVTAGYRLEGLTGGFFESSTNVYSSYIQVLPNTTYSVTEGNHTHFYDKDKKFISGHETNINTFTTPPNTYYLRTSIRKVKLETFMLVEGTTVPADSDYIPYNRYSTSLNLIGDTQNKPHVGKKLAITGDSIANNAYFETQVKDELGFDSVTNYSVGGSSYVERDGEWGENSLSVRYSEVATDHDVVLVWSGTNDFSTSVGLGTFDDRGTDTFYGALHTTYSGLVNRLPTKKIAVLTMPPRYSRNNTLGETVYDYANAIKEVAGYYHIPCLDILHHSQLRPWNEQNKQAFTRDGDGLHPSVPEGYDLLLPRIIEFLRTI